MILLLIMIRIKNIIKFMNLYIINNNKVNALYKHFLDNFHNENGKRYIGEMKNALKHRKGILYHNKYD